MTIPLPSSRLSTYTSAGGLFQLRHPANWQVFPAREGEGVSILPEGGLLYGIFVSPEVDAEQLQLTFQRIISSLQVLR